MRCPVIGLGEFLRSESANTLETLSRQRLFGCSIEAITIVSRLSSIFCVSILSIKPKAHIRILTVIPSVVRHKPIDNTIETAPSTMSKVLKKLAASRRDVRASKHTSNKNQHDRDETSHSPLTSPVSVATVNRGSYNEDLIAPYTESGELRPERSIQHRGSSSIFDESIFRESAIGDISEGDYQDLGNDSFFLEGDDFHRGSSTSSSNRKSRESDYREARVKSISQPRCSSVQRPMQESSMEIIERADETLEKSRRRSRSTGRSSRREQVATDTVQLYNMNNLEQAVNNHESSPRIKKSKMEKILQLQEKNQRYKDEFRKVQKDRKVIKKELENKKLETAALTKEIDSYLSETSMLKLKLSEALQQLDRTEYDERKDKSVIAKLQKELTATHGDYNAAVARVARMREEVEAMKVSAARKDEQIKNLTAEVAEQSAIVDSLHLDTIQLKSGQSFVDQRELKDLRVENQRLQKELSDTLQNASSMVKEREDAIADLLKENDEMKRLLEVQQQQGESSEVDVSQEEITQLRTELDIAAAALEESQDRTLLLEEEVEAWISRGHEMESEIERLRDDVDCWQRKAESAEETILVVESSAQESSKKLSEMNAALSEAERRHKEQLQELERRHSEDLWDLKERTEQRVNEAKQAFKPNPQDEALRLAMAKKEAKKLTTGGSWGLIQQLRGRSEDDEDLTDEQRKIKELEQTNEEQGKELEKTKSELVQLLSTHREAKYTNQKRIESLEEENMAFVAKIKTMEVELVSLRKALSNGSPDMISESSHSQASF